jgi:hypothetical protein
MAEFMFEVYLRNHTDETTDYCPYDTKWGFESDTAARWGAVALMDDIAFEGHDVSEMWCLFQKDSNDWLDDPKEFTTYNGMDYDDIDNWIEHTRTEKRVDK